MLFSRKIISPIICLCAISFTIYISWGGHQNHKTEHKSHPQQHINTDDILNENILVAQSKLIVGAKYFFESVKNNNTPLKNNPDTFKTIQEAFTNTLFKTHENPLEKTDTSNSREPISLLRKKLALARYFHLKQIEETIRTQVTTKISTGDIDKTELSKTNLLLKLFRYSPNIPSDNTPLTEFEIKTLKKDLLWIHNLAFYSALTNESEKKRLENKFSKEAQSTFITFCLGILFFGVITLASLASLLTYSIRFLWGKFQVSGVKQGLAGELMIETFTAYILFFTLGSLAIEKLTTLGLIKGTLLFTLKLNALLIFSSLVTLSWSRFFGYSWKTIFENAGIYSKGVWENLKSIWNGLFFYVGALTPLMILMIFYGFILQYFKISPAKGAHPVVKMISVAPGNSTTIILILIAAGLAPIVEEIMFRGFLYGYLRRRFGILISVAISSFIFAAVHPQGLIGILPLFCIGAILACIREWQGNLIASIAVHSAHNLSVMTIFLLGREVIMS